MADEVFNISKGAVAETYRDAAANGIVLLMKAAESDALLRDYDDIAALFVPAGNTEATFTAYVRKTGITGTVTVDDTGDRVDVDFPDQTWSPAGGASNDTLAKAVVAYENAAADATRVPQTHHDFVVTTNGGDITIEFNAAGFFRAA